VGLCPVLLEGQQKPHGDKSDKSPQAGLQESCRVPNKGAQSGPKEGPTGFYGAPFKLVRKSKTHDSALGAGARAASAETLASSASFSGSPSSLTRAGGCGSQRMIDYRHFVPQMPFVPAVAKSIPRKRISLKRPKKCFRNLFHLHRNKPENLAALETKSKALSLPGSQMDRTEGQRAAFVHLGEGPGSDSLCQDSELPLDSSFDLCGTLCEDVASLKSFDSLTGCGEIFADESSVPCLELSGDSECPVQEPQSLESKVPRVPSQACLDQLASLTHNEVSGFTKFWDSVNHSVEQQHALLGPWLEASKAPSREHLKLDTAGLASLPLCPCKTPHRDSKASSIDTGTPKSEQPESVSTSDEGYYDSFSPGLEEDKKKAQSPGTPAPPFLQDSYSGDALYEFFCDPSEGPGSPGLNDDEDDSPGVAESLSGLTMGTPLSMCSFHTGAEENLAPMPSPNVLDHGFLQSSWKGTECLLKLCDTELSITMGIINWLRRGPELQPLPVPAPGDSAAPSSPKRASGGPVEKRAVGSVEASPWPESLEGRGNWTSDAERATVCSARTGQGLWTRSGTQGLPARESKVSGMPKWRTCSPFRDPSRELLQVSEEEGLFSSLRSAVTVTADSSSKSKASRPSAWIGSQKEPRPPMDLGCLPDPWRLGLGGNTLEPDPCMMGCVAQVAGQHGHQDSQHWAENHQRQDIFRGLCGRPVARSPAPLQQGESPGSPSSPGSPHHGSPVANPGWTLKSTEIIEAICVKENFLLNNSWRHRSVGANRSPPCPAKSEGGQMPEQVPRFVSKRQHSKQMRDGRGADPVASAEPGLQEAPGAGDDVPR
ncbi:APC membrane recruitment protein 3, partial [Echinops telfairi]|uniref:APC membrane recruitment protein 3 n=1 Tax=Echinops telfairi TaxID=9371 RepID=A0AC55DR89_ECHTE